MTTEYTFSLTGDFGNNLNSIQLHQAIVSSGGITTPFRGINVLGDDVDIIFNNVLSESEETLMEDLVANYTILDTPKPKIQKYSVDLKDNQMDDTNKWKVIKTFIYSGKANIGEIDYIEFIAYKDPGIDSYDIKITLGDDIIAQKLGLTNDVGEIIDMGAVNNNLIPNSKSKMDVEVRKNGGAKKEIVYIDDMLIYHGN